MSEWTRWADKRPEDHTIPYRWRVEAREICGMTLRPEWTEKLRSVGMGLGNREWWPLLSHWDGYQRACPTSLEWRVATEAESAPGRYSPRLDPQHIHWGGLDLLPNPHTGKPPVVGYSGKYTGARPYLVSSLILKVRGGSHWHDANAMKQWWNGLVGWQVLRPMSEAPLDTWVLAELRPEIFDDLNHMVVMREGEHIWEATGGGYSPEIFVGWRPLPGGEA